MSSFIFRAQRAHFNRGVELHMAERAGDRLNVAVNAVMRELAEGEMSEPFLRMSLTDAQSLMDELWHCGLRPTEGTGSAGSLAATERHLEDMRRLVFKGKP